MLLAFLLGLLAVAATIAVITIAVMGAKWLKNYILKRKEENKNHKVVFADTRDVVDDYLRSKADAAYEISMSELEEMCEKTPFVAVDLDRNTDELENYEGIKADEVDENFSVNMKKHEGILIFD
jgi:hypothetical protein